MKLFVIALAATLPPGPAPSTKELCELRIWPAQATNAVRSGVLSNFGMIGAYAEASGDASARLQDQASLIEALGMAQQAQAMIAIDLPRLMGVESVKLVFDTTPLEIRSAAKARRRLSGSSLPCYVELIIGMNEFRASAVRGASLRTLLTFRDFRGGKLKIVSAGEASPLQHFPAAAPGLEEKARQDLSAAFAANLTSFARRVAKKP